MEDLKIVPFSDVDLGSEFFDSLRFDYEGFDEWFRRKANSNAKAYVYYVNGELKDFLYLKRENEEIQIDDKNLPPKRRLKVGTFKIERRGSNRGERFMKKILDAAIVSDVEEVYVTIFDDRDETIHLRHFFEKYGFQIIGVKTHPNKRKESYLIRDMKMLTGNIVKDYPYIALKDKRKFSLSIYPEYHTKLFPDSILRGEPISMIADLSATNSINKIYICFMQNVDTLRHGDVLAIYRTKDKSTQSATYRSVITSLCTVDEIKTRSDFANVDDFIKYSNKYSIFNETELRGWYSRRGNLTVIKMLYNLTFGKKVIKKELEELGISPQYWGFFRIPDEQFDELIKLGKVDSRYLK